MPWSLALARSPLLLAAGAALAVSITSSAGAVTLCSGACPVVGVPPSHPEASFDFVAGLRADEGEDVSLSASGSIYIYGNLTATGNASFVAGESITLDGTIDLGTGPDAGNVTIDVLSTTGAPVGPGGGLIVIGGGGGVSIDDTGLTVSSPGLPLILDFDGDVYLDIAGITVANFAVTAGQHIVLDANTPVFFTPEPGSAILVCVGLSLLAGRRSRGARIERS